MRKKELLEAGALLDTLWKLAQAWQRPSIPRSFAILRELLEREIDES